MGWVIRLFVGGAFCDGDSLWMNMVILGFQVFRYLLCRTRINYCDE